MTTKRKISRELQFRLLIIIDIFHFFVIIYIFGVSFSTVQIDHVALVLLRIDASFLQLCFSLSYQCVNLFVDLWNIALRFYENLMKLIESDPCMEDTLNRSGILTSRAVKQQCKTFAARSGLLLYANPSKYHTSATSSCSSDRILRISAAVSGLFNSRNSLAVAIRNSKIGMPSIIAASSARRQRLVNVSRQILRHSIYGINACVRVNCCAKDLR